MTTPSTKFDELTVSQLSAMLRQVVEGSFGRVRVKGEISGAKRAPSGHMYLALKDSDAVLDAVCWRGQADRLASLLVDGLEVVALGKLTIYPGRSKYQLIIDGLEPAGQGALLKMLEERKKRLAAEGLFAAERKRPLPVLPRAIGVVTSATGAVLQDILHRVAERYPCPVYLWSVLVQGETAAAQIAAAITGFNTHQHLWPLVDVLIVARGGGSLEDLMPFNDEAVVRAAAASRLPLISAVGHETDVTLIDYAADKRAPTPTAAAELALPVRADLLAYLDDISARQQRSLQALLQRAREAVRGLGRGLRHPSLWLQSKQQQLDERGERLQLALQNYLQRSRVRLAQAARLPRPASVIQRADEKLRHSSGRLTRGTQVHLERAQAALKQVVATLTAYSYHRTLQRGYALILDEAEQPLTQRHQLPAGRQVRLRLQDGDSTAVIK